MSSFFSNQALELDQQMRDGRVTKEHLQLLMEHPEGIFQTDWHKQMVGMIPDDCVGGSVRHAQMISGHRSPIYSARISDSKKQREAYRIIDTFGVHRDFTDWGVERHGGWNVHMSFLHWDKGTLRFALVKSHEIDGGVIVTEEGETPVPGHVSWPLFTSKGLFYAFQEDSEWFVQHGEKRYGPWSAAEELTTDGTMVAYRVQKEGYQELMRDHTVMATSRSSGCRMEHVSVTGGRVGFLEDRKTYRLFPKVYEPLMPSENWDVNVEDSPDSFKPVGSRLLVRNSKKNRGVFLGDQRLASLREWDGPFIRSNAPWLWAARDRALFLTGRFGEGLRIHLDFDRSEAFERIFEPEITEHEVRVVACRGRNLFLLTHPL